MHQKRQRHGANLAMMEGPSPHACPVALARALREPNDRHAAINPKAAFFAAVTGHFAAHLAPVHHVLHTRAGRQVLHDPRQ